MDKIDLNTILNRNSIEKEIEDLLENFNKANVKRGIFIHGNRGIGKTQFVLKLLRKLNYDIIYYDNTTIRNKVLIESIGNETCCKTNVHSLLTNKPKKIVIVIDDIDGMNCGDKNGIISLIKLIRLKKTKKQKLEAISNNPIICINNKTNDKKIIELMKVCNVFELDNPTNEQLIDILINVKPDIFKYDKNTNNIIRNNILEFLDNKLTSFKKIIFYEKNERIYDIFYNNYNNKINNNNFNIKSITKSFLEKYYDFSKLNSVLECDRTIVSLLFHENIINNLNQSSEHLDIYLKLLDNFIFCDYIDRVIFQKQIWQLIEINYIIKLFYNNNILKNNNLLKNNSIENIIFTKVLTKYSSEYNNYIFIYNLLQYFQIEKKDIFLFFYINSNINNITKLSDSLNIFNISKLEILRIIKLINNIINYKVDNKKIDASNDCEYENDNNLNID